MTGTAGGQPLPIGTEHPFTSPDLLRRAWPFGAALALGFASLPLVPISDPAPVAAAGALALAIVLFAALAPWDRLPRWAATLPPLATAGVVFLLREGTGGLRDPVDYEALLLLPVLWLALYGTRGELLAVLALTAATFALSIALAGVDGGDGGEWVKAVFWPAVAGLVGLRTQALVSQVRTLSQFDALTGVLNRRHWEVELIRELARARRSGSELSVAMIDLDHFKRLNDRDGHAAGDRALRACADAWAATLRLTDVIGRYGGEEFVLLLPDAALPAALNAAERVREATPGPITCSVGVATFDGSEGPEDLVARADAALYRAKSAGRDRVEAA